MRVVKWIPEACKGLDAEFQGHLMIESLGYEQRIQMLESSGVEFVNGEVEKNLKNIVAMGKLAIKMKPFVKEVVLTYKPESLEIKSFEDMEHDPVCGKVMQELAALALNGVRPSKE